MTTTRFATADDGTRIAYEVHDGRAPDGDWLLLIHGLGYARWGWEPLLPHLEHRFRLILFDNRGIGDSDVPDGPYSAEGMAQDPVAVLDAAGVDRAHVVGTSLGGMIAQELALAHPRRVERLVLISSTPGAETGHPMPEVTQRLIAEMPEMDPQQALHRAVENALSDRTVEQRPEVVERIVHHRTAEPQDPAGWQAQAAAGTGYEGGQRLRGIEVPTLILHGTEDVVVDPRNADVLTELIPDSEARRVAGAGHLPYWEDPEGVAQQLVGFLAAGDA